MKIVILVCLSGMISLVCNGQSATLALEKKPQPLADRYAVMKSNSQTFQDYKVIKEYILDGVWKISMDTLAAMEQRLVRSNVKIKSLQTDLASLQSEFEQHKKAVAQMEYDSKHISLIGISFSKNTFRLLMVVVIGALISVIVFISGSWKLSRSKMKEHMLMTDLISREFDDFKKKSLEKQVKLSRQLQDERNKQLSATR